MVVLALTAIFERALRTHLSRITLAALPVGEPQKEAFLKAILDDIERWNFTRIVDLFPNVPTDLRGQIR